MTVHFLLSAAARTLSLREIYKGGEDAAYETFKRMRWEDGQPVCPKCGSVEAYEITTRRKFKCKGCTHQFSVTSGTIFASRKMAFVDLLAAICIFVNAVKGLSALQLGRDLDVQYKTAFVLSHKLREALAREVEGKVLDGEVEIDGAYFGGHIRPANLKEDRIDRRKVEHQTGTRRVVVAMRQRKGRTLTFVTKGEDEGVELAARYVDRLATIFADEASHWDHLHQAWPTYRINHSAAYSLDGANTNAVESFFSRLRRMVNGQHHGVSPKYLHQYASHAAWLEDHRRRSNGVNADAVVANAMKAPVSRVWKGYWQR
ncbi:MAG: IS1595 family transposase [Devosia sp.]|uniref:IS1595 family transposase n=1 Tax=Devosia sp. TaxID=1871048 RepID=UPI001A63FD0A|nr:IS1595 family transposase [Devosia sp.]MBL8597721.1 IS1595 family transposase [Devosia sp.]